MDTLEDVGWYVTLIIFTPSICGGIKTNSITNPFEQCYIPLMPIHAWMPQNSRNSHQISHLTRAQQIKLEKLQTTNNLHLSNHQEPHMETKTLRMNPTSWCLLKPHPLQYPLDIHTMRHNHILINMPIPPYAHSCLWLPIGTIFERSIAFVHALLGQPCQVHIELLVIIRGSLSLSFVFT